MIITEMYSRGSKRCSSGTVKQNSVGTGTRIRTAKRVAMTSQNRVRPFHHFKAEQGYCRLAALGTTRSSKIEGILRACLQSLPYLVPICSCKLNCDREVLVEYDIVINRSWQMNIQEGKSMNPVTTFGRPTLTKAGNVTPHSGKEC